MGSAEGVPWGQLWLQPQGIPLTRLCRLSSYGAGFPMGTQQGGKGQKQHWQRRDCEGECAELLSPKSGAARSFGAGGYRICGVPLTCISFMFMTVGGGRKVPRR